MPVLPPTLAPAVTPMVVLTSDTVTSGALPLALAVAVLAGLVSFASPCVLPLVPGFLGYVTGLTGEPLAQRSRSRLVTGALLFVLVLTLCVGFGLGRATSGGCVRISWEAK